MDDVKQRIRAMASSLEKGGLSKIATAYTGELEALQKGNSGPTAVRIHKCNYVGKRAKEAEVAYRKAKKAERDLTGAVDKRALICTR